MMTNHKLSDARREALYAELHALLGAGLDFSAAFRLLIEGESDRKMRHCSKRSTPMSCAAVRSTKRCSAAEHSELWNVV